MLVATVCNGIVLDGYTIQYLRLAAAKVSGMEYKFPHDCRYDCGELEPHLWPLRVFTQSQSLSTAQTAMQPSAEPLSRCVGPRELSKGV